MHRERMYTMIGMFVTGAILLIITSAVFLYDSWSRARVSTYVMFFKGSLQGLENNAPVTYRGIKIGEVIRIEITESASNKAVQIPVYVQFSVDKTFGAPGNPIQLLITKGMVANITSPNFLTGRSTIEIAPAPILKKFKQRNFRNHPVFPTRNKIEKFITLDQTLEEVKKTLENIQVLVRSREITDAFLAVRSMAEHVEKLAKQLGEDTPNLFSSMETSLKQINNTTLSIQNFTDYLSRYPESLLRGKK